MSTELPLVGDYSTAAPSDSGARVGIAVFPGTLGQHDAARALRLAGITPVMLWHQDEDLSGVSAVILPGGCSYGDYLRPGALAAQAPLMRAITKAAEAGIPVLGTGNGFQILVEAGLLPGAFLPNASARYHAGAEVLRIENATTAFTSEFQQGAEVTIPVKAGYANYFVPADEAASLAEKQQIVARYLENPQGATDSIAGVCNAAGNVVGLLPQAEYAVEQGFGPSTDGAVVFSSLRAAITGGK